MIQSIIEFAIEFAILASFSVLIFLWVRRSFMRDHRRLMKDLEERQAEFEEECRAFDKALNEKEGREWT